MVVIVNGQEIEVNSNVRTITDLIDHYQLKAEYVVAEVNGVVVERIDWAMFELKPGAQIELVHFVGGG